MLKIVRCLIVSGRLGSNLLTFEQRDVESGGNF